MNTNKTNKFGKLFMDIAERTGALSTCIRLKVGAIAVKDQRIISIGYNGSLPGHNNCCEERIYLGTEGTWVDENTIKEFPYTDDDGNHYKLKTKVTTLHAEENLLGKLAQSNESAKDATIFITHEPCMNCSKTLAVSGVKAVYYKNEYRDVGGAEFLRSAGITAEKL